MRNKLITISFAILATLSVAGQSTVSDELQAGQISIYPNPAVETVFIELDNTFNKPQFELNSMIGNRMVIKPEEIGSGKYRISLKDFATGYYFLIVTDEKRPNIRAAHKLLKN